jgi:hypothetical protein
VLEQAKLARPCLAWAPAAARSPRTFIEADGHARLLQPGQVGRLQVGRADVGAIGPAGYPEVVGSAAADGSPVPVVPLFSRTPVPSQDALTSSRTTKRSRIKASQARRASFYPLQEEVDLSIGTDNRLGIGRAPAGQQLAAGPSLNRATMSVTRCVITCPDLSRRPGALALPPAHTAREAQDSWFPRPDAGSRRDCQYPPVPVGVLCQVSVQRPRGKCAPLSQRPW